MRRIAGLAILIAHTFRKCLEAAPQKYLMIDPGGYPLQAKIGPQHRVRHLSVEDSTPASLELWVNTPIDMDIGAETTARHVCLALDEFIGNKPNGTHALDSSSGSGPSRIRVVWSGDR
ncbi:hypothetical protein GGS21DRAFT_490416 [Xylaria nigripes]|nr:hypothetical protein GGS21DRAFT_490416 [Xylaria nigripes]